MPLSRKAALALSLLLAAPAFAADHRDGPLTTGDPTADINDVYTFVNPNNPAELILATTVVPLATANSRFSDAVEYRFHIDNGAANGNQVIRCTTSAQSTQISCIGPNGLTASGGINRVLQGTGLRVFAGLRDDPFFFDLNAFNRTRTTLVPAFTNPGVNFFTGAGTLAIVLGIESNRISNNGANPVFKVYGSTRRFGDIGISSGFTGLWLDPANAGHGIQLEVLGPKDPGGPDRVTITWFTYNRFGEQRWVIGDGNINGSTANVTNAVYTSGGVSPPQFSSAQVTTTAFGSLSMTFTDCNTGTLNFTTTSSQFASGSIPVTRLTAVKNLPCTFYTGGQIDRMGRPGINTVAIDLLASTGKKDLYNKADNPALWASLFQSEIQSNITALDTLDGVTGNTLLPPATLATVLVDDRLIIDVSKTQCDAYLAVELGLNQCGGRALPRDVIDDSLGALVGPGVSDNVANDSTFLGDFPFLGTPL